MIRKKLYLSDNERATLYGKRFFMTFTVEEFYKYRMNDTVNVNWDRAVGHCRRDIYKILCRCEMVEEDGKKTLYLNGYKCVYDNDTDVLTLLKGNYKLTKVRSQVVLGLYKKLFTLYVDGVLVNGTERAYQEQKKIYRSLLWIYKKIMNSEEYDNLYNANEKKLCIMYLERKIKKYNTEIDSKK